MALCEQAQQLSIRLIQAVQLGLEAAHEAQGADPSSTVVIDPNVAERLADITASQHAVSKHMQQCDTCVDR